MDTRTVPRESPETRSLGSQSRCVLASIQGQHVAGAGKELAIAHCLHPFLLPLLVSTEGTFLHTERQGGGGRDLVGGGGNKRYQLSTAI